MKRCNDRDVAISLAVKLHEGHYRSNGIPYVTHLLEVFKKVAEYSQDGVNQGVIEVASLLHDSWEDGRIESLEKLEVLLRQNDLQPASAIVAVVGEVSMPPDRNFGSTEKYSWLTGFSGKSFEALVLKIADRVCNVRDHQVTGKGMEYAAFYALQASPVFQDFLVRVRTKGLSVSVQMQRDMRLIQAAVDYRWPGRFCMFAEASQEKMDEIRRLVTGSEAG